MGSVHDAVAEAARRLEAAGLSARDARFDAEVLARHVLGWDRAAFFTYGRDAAAAGFPERFAQLIERRARREPVAYITGRREFMGLEFEVTADVLIPRPETELTVEAALEAARQLPGTPIIDVGTGSGCIAIALAVALPDARVVATDVSLRALHMARRNAVRHGVAGRVRFVRTNLLDGLHTRGLVVSNPPYVPNAAAAALQPEVGAHEPGVALYGGADGLDIVRELLSSAANHVTPGSRLIFEFGDGQEDQVRDAAAERGWHMLEVRDDLQGIARVAVLAR